MNPSDYPQVVERFSQIYPDKPFPTDYHKWVQSDTQAAMQLRNRDPVLYSILSGDMPSTTMSAVMNGQLSTKPPEQGEIDSKQRSAEVQALYTKVSGIALDADGNRLEATMTDRLRLMSLDERVFAKASAEYQARFGRPVDQQQQEAQRQQDEHRRVQSRNHYGSRY